MNKKKKKVLPPHSFFDGGAWSNFWNTGASSNSDIYANMADLAGNATQAASAANGSNGSNGGSKWDSINKTFQNIDPQTGEVDTTHSDNPELKKTMSSLGNSLRSKNGLGAIGAAAGQVANKYISDGYENTAGDVGNAIGDVVSNIPGPWGAAISFAVKAISGGINRIWGTKTDAKKEALAQASRDTLGAFKSDANSFDSVQGPTGLYMTKVYKGGPLNWGTKHSAADKQYELDHSIITNYERAQDSVKNNVNNLQNQQMKNILANYSAFGGPLEYSFANEAMLSDQVNTLNQQSFKSLPNSFGGANTIGLFADGGNLNGHGAFFNDGVKEINVGSTHEANPNGGVQQGVAADGLPNFVEEGEVIKDNKVLSNRIKTKQAVEGAIRQKYKLRDNLSIADAYKELTKKGKDYTDNDPIWNREKSEVFNMLYDAQEGYKQKEAQKQQAKQLANQIMSMPPDQQQQLALDAQQMAFGGHMHGLGDNLRNIFSKFGNVFKKNTDVDEEDPNAENEFPWDPIQQNPYPNEVVFGQNNTPYTYYNPNTTIPQNDQAARNDFQNALKTYNIQPKEDQTPSVNLNPDELNTQQPLSEPEDEQKKQELLPTWMRTAPMLGNAIGLGLALKRPDYSNANLIQSAATRAGQYKSVGFTPIGQKLAYNPIDTNYYANIQRAQTQSLNDRFRDAAAGNRATLMASLLGSQYNANTNLADMLFKADDSNFQQRAKVTDFNRQTDAMNSEGMMKADTANSAAQQAANAAYLQGMTQVANMRQAIDNGRAAAISANLSALANNLGEYGKENMAMNMIATNPSLYYTIGKDGQIKYKSGFAKLPKAQQKLIKEAAEKDKKAIGG